MRVLIACEFSGTVRRAFAARGWHAVSIDMLPSEDCPMGPLQQHWIGDVRDYLGCDWDLMIAHPPCTRLANSGVRWLHKPPRGRTVSEMWADLEHAAAFYKALRDAPIPRKAIENPIMHKYARELIKPGRRQIVQPWQFGEPAFKATGFELIGLPDLVPTNVLAIPAKGTEEHKRWSAVHREPPGPERWKNRSRTFKGIADAFASQWGSINY